jgi:hypothetical protein
MTLSWATATQDHSDKNSGEIRKPNERKPMAWPKTDYEVLRVSAPAKVRSTASGSGDII